MSEQPAAGYIATRSVGDAVVSVISEGTLDWAPKFAVPETEWRRALPEADAEGRVTLGINLAHVRLGDASIVIDPGCDDPGSPWQTAFAGRFASVTRTPGIAAALAAIDVRPEDVTHVLITHSHSDHFGGVVVERVGELVPRFPNARHLIGRADWEESPARQQPGSELVERLGLIERLGLLELVEGEREVVPGVTMIPTPGESPGHTAVRVESGGERFYFVGDLFHHGCEIAHPDWAPPGRDEPALRESRRRLIDEAAPSGATVVFAHEPFPGSGRIVEADGGYRWERV